jgi:hypothetical protein
VSKTYPKGNATQACNLCARFMAAELAALMLRHAAAEACKAQCGMRGALFPRAGAMAARYAHALIHLEGLGCGST